VKFKTKKAAKAVKAANSLKFKFKPLKKSVLLVLFTQSWFFLYKHGLLFLTDYKTNYT
jgi:hypothetical protein